MMETSTLTEQWRNGTIKAGYYYVTFQKGYGEDVIPHICFISHSSSFKIKKVFAPVPSYNDWIEYGTESYSEMVTKCSQLEKTIHDLEYQKHGIQCVLHDCFMTLQLNKIITPDMKFFEDIVRAKGC